MSGIGYCSNPISSPRTFDVCFFSLFSVFDELSINYRVPPSIYAIFSTIMASNGCNQIGKDYGPMITSLAPGELSTIVFPLTKVYNFNDLPCPPSGIKLPPGATYAPLLAPASFIYDLDPAFSTCVPGYSQEVDPPFDPPIAHVTARYGLLGQAMFLLAETLGAHARPHAGPSGPAKTAEPKH